MFKKSLILIGLIAILFNLSLISAETNSACSDTICISEETTYGILNNQVDVTITNLLNKKQEININSNFIDSLKTNSLNYNNVQVLEYFDVPTFETQKIKIGNCKDIINDTACFDNKKDLLHCSAGIEEKSGQCLQYQRVENGTAQYSKYRPLLTNPIKEKANGKLNYKQTDLSLASKETKYFKWSVEHPRFYDYENPDSITNKYDIKVQSSIPCKSEKNCENGVTVLDPTWWNSNWLNSIKHTYTYTGSLSNYTVRLDLNSSKVGTHFDWTADENATRFTDVSNTTEYDYWIEYWNATAEEAIIWVEVESISGNGAFYQYYNNTGASYGANCTETFPSCDEFSGSSLNLAKWEIIEEDEITVGGGYLTLNVSTGYEPDSGIYDKGFNYSITQGNFAIRNKILTTSTASGASPFFALGESSDTSDHIRARSNQGDATCHLRTQNDGSTSQTTFTCPTVDVFYTYELTWNSSEVNLYSDDVLLQTHSAHIPDEALIGGLYFNKGSSQAGNDMWLQADFYIVRKWTENEPAYSSTGSENNYSIGDTTPPTQSAHNPADSSTIASTSQVVTFTTNEDADCKWSLTDQAYGDMAGDCTGDGTTSQSCSVTGMSEGAEVVYFACQDNATNADTIATNEEISYTIDTTPPTLSWNWTDINSTIAVNYTTVCVNASETLDNCTFHFNGTDYDNLTDATNLCYNITSITDGNYTVNATCYDLAGNEANTTTGWVDIVDTSIFDSSLWGRKAPITFIRPASDLTNFPALITNRVLPEEMWNTTYGASYLANADGCDIRFTKDIQGTAELPFELVTWEQDSTTGSEIWVKTNISSVINTTIWVWYNYTSATCYVSNASYGSENVWNDYVAVYHLGETVNNDAGGYGDSTSEQYNGTGTSMALSGTGQIGGGQQFDGGADYITLPLGVLSNSGTKGTMCAWAKPDQPSSDSNPLGITATRNSDSIYFTFFESNGFLQISYTNGGGPSVYIGADILDTATNWEYYCMVSDDSQWLTYINSTWYNLSVPLLGNNDGDWYAAAVGPGTTPKIGFFDILSYNYYFDGNMDEVRLSTLNRSQDWIEAEYLNQINPTYFVTNDYSISVNETTDSMKDLRVIAMNESEVGDLLFEGYSSITPDNLEVRVIRTDTNATVQIAGKDWTNLTGFSIESNGFWNGTLEEIPKTNSWLNFELRVSNNTAYNYTTSNRIGVGYVVLYAGQSYIDFWLDWIPNITPHETPSGLTSKFRDKKTGQANGNAGAYTGWAENTGSGSITFANKLQETLECPIGVLDYGMAGSALIEANKINPYGYWIGSHDTDNWLDDVYEGVLVSEPTSRTKINAVLWYQGYTDGYAGVTYNDFYNNLGYLFGNFTNLSNNDNLAIYLVGQPRSQSPDTSVDAGFNNMRLATIDRAEDNLTDTIYFAGQTIDFPLYDLVHLTNESQINESLRYAQSLLYNEVGTGNFAYSGIGPRVTGYFLINSTTTAVKIQHEGGTDFTPSTNIDSFQVQNTTNWFWVNGTRHDSTTVYLNTSGITVTNLRILYGRDPPISGILKDNSPLQLPILIEDVVALIDGLPPTYSLNQTNNTNAGKLTLFSLSVNDDTLLQTAGQYVFSTNNTGTWTNDSAINFTATPQWANVTKTLNDTVGIKIGYKWYLTDNAGNSAETPIYNLTTISGDTTPPSLDWNWTDINSTITVNTTFICINTSESANGTLHFNGTDYDNATLSTNICWNMTGLADGNYTINATLFDTYSNSVNTTNAWLYVDTTAPTITWNINDTTIESDGIDVAYINVSCSDVGGMDEMIYNQTYPNGTIELELVGVIGFEVAYPFSATIVGDHLINVTCTDLAGNSIWQNRTITVEDTTPPTITWDWDNINSTTGVNNTIVNVTLSEIGNCTLLVSGTPYINTTNATSIGWYLTNFANGNYTINATCEDIYGNSATSTDSWWNVSVGGAIPYTGNMTANNITFTSSDYSVSVDEWFNLYWTILVDGGNVSELNVSIINNHFECVFRNSSAMTWTYTDTDSEASHATFSCGAQDNSGYDFILNVSYTNSTGTYDLSKSLIVVLPVSIGDGEDGGGDTGDTPLETNDSIIEEVTEPTVEQGEEELQIFDGMTLAEFTEIASENWLVILIGSIMTVLLLFVFVKGKKKKKK